MRSRQRALGRVSDAFFYGYTGMCVVAGAMGAVFARTDVALISGFHPSDQLREHSAATMLSQHRFLRALEMGLIAATPRGSDPCCEGSSRPRSRAPVPDPCCK